MKKYYIEIFKEYSGDYIIQSDWFDSEEQAIEWCKTIAYLDIYNYGLWVMSSEWDEESDTHTDIEYVREIMIGENRL